MSLANAIRSRRRSTTALDTSPPRTSTRRRGTAQRVRPSRPTSTSMVYSVPGASASMTSSGVATARSVSRSRATVTPFEELPRRGLTMTGKNWPEPGSEDAVVAQLVGGRKTVVPQPAVGLGLVGRDLDDLGRRHGDRHAVPLVTGVAHRGPGRQLDVDGRHDQADLLPPAQVEHHRQEVAVGARRHEERLVGQLERGRRPLGVDGHHGALDAHLVERLPQEAQEHDTPAGRRDQDVEPSLLQAAALTLRPTLRLRRRWSTDNGGDIAASDGSTSAQRSPVW